MIIYLFLFYYSDMNKLCQILNDNINLNYDITFYIKQSGEDNISYNCDDPYDTIDYINNNLNEKLFKYNYDTIIDYYNYKITFLYNDRRCTITNKFLNNNCSYWILYIDLI